MQVKDLDIDSGCTPLLNSYLKLNVPEYITGCFTYFLMGMSEITYLEKKKVLLKSTSTEQNDLITVSLVAVNSYEHLLVSSYTTLYTIVTTKLQPDTMKLKRVILFWCYSLGLTILY